MSSDTNESSVIEQAKQSGMPQWRATKWYANGVHDLAQMLAIDALVDPWTFASLPRHTRRQPDEVVAVLTGLNDDLRSTALDMLRRGLDVAQVGENIKFGLNPRLVLVAGRSGVTDPAVIALLDTEEIATATRRGAWYPHRSPAREWYATNPATYQALGINDPDEWIALKNKGLTPNDASDFFDAGLTSVNDMLALIAAGVHGPDYQTFCSRGIADIEDVLFLANAGVEAGKVGAYLTIGADLQEMAALAIEGVNPSDLADYWINGVRDRHVAKALAQRGYSGEDVAGLRWLGIADAEMSDPWIRRGLNPEIAAGLAAARMGQGDPDLAVRISLSRMDISDAIARRDALGYFVPLDGTRVADVVAGVPDTQVRLRTGGRLLPVRVAGVVLVAARAEDAEILDAEVSYAALGGASRFTTVLGAWEDAVCDDRQSGTSLPEGLRDCLPAARLAYGAMVWSGFGPDGVTPLGDRTPFDLR